MTTDAKPTKGPWHISEDESNGDRLISVDSEARHITLHTFELPEDLANARLIAESGTIHHETGLTPRQLAEQRKELLEAAERARGLLADLGHQDTRYFPVFQSLCAAIAKARGEAELAV